MRHSFHFVWLNLLFGLASSLKSLQIRVPIAVLAGSSPELTCSYDLEGAQLYSIRWYRGMVEFYRFVPKESPATRVFPVADIRVDLSRSDEHRVVLSEVVSSLTGAYQCEVSADAPLFHTDIKAANMFVVEPPLSGPNVTADKVQYLGGDRIRAYCSLPPSIPAANLTFVVNSQMVPGYISTQNSNSTLTPTQSNAVLELEAAQLSPVPKLVISCEASLFDVWSAMSNTIVLKEKTANPFSALGRSLNDATRGRKTSGILILLIQLIVSFSNSLIHSEFCLR